MALGTSQSPQREFNLHSGPFIGEGATVSNVLSTGGGAETMTVAELLKGLLVADTQDAQTWTLPTADLIAAALPGLVVGSWFEFSIVNYGDSTLTIGLGTGISKTTIATVAAVMTIATLTCKRFRLECTGRKNPSDPSKSNTFVVWTIAAGTAVA